MTYNKLLKTLLFATLDAAQPRPLAGRYVYGMKLFYVLFLLLIGSNIAMAKDFKQGQIWKYNTRSIEPDSRLVVVQVDDINGEKIVHISVNGLRLKNPQSDTGYGEEISHMPISPEALSKSVIELDGLADELPDYKEGYGIWREAYDSGKAGVFSITVKESVGFMEDTVNQ